MNVVFGFLGTTLDAGGNLSRWERWRPTVGLAMQPDFVVHRLELLCDIRRNNPLAKQIRQDVQQVSPETEVRIHDLYLKDPWDFPDVYERVLDFCEGYAFDPEHERYLAHLTTGTHVAQICWFLLAESRRFPGQMLQTAPPRKGETDVAGHLSIIDLDLSRYDRIAQRFALEAQQDRSLLKSGIATVNPRFNRMIEQVEVVATRSDAPMLLLGPTGAGKSQLARRVFELKKQRGRVAGNFVEVNCATLRGDGAMSALFGHRRGAFTGAVADRPGLLRSADRGLLFLDEIGELGADEQAMLLRALEDKRFLPVGSDREVESDFQLIAGTNRDLGERIADGRFREDLYSRLNIWTFELPALIERREDIEVNIDFELARYERQHGERVRFNREARSAYLAYARSPDAVWSGNFRDLNASMLRMATLAPAGRIDEATVADEIARLRRLWRREAEPQDDLLQEVLGDGASALDRFDRVQLAEVIRCCRNSRNLADAGRALFAQSRQQRSSTNDGDRLRKYLAKFGLDWARVRGVSDDLS